MSKVAFNDLPSMDHQYKDEEVTQISHSMVLAEKEARDNMEEKFEELLNWLIVAIMIMIPVAIAVVIFIIGVGLH